MQRVLGMLLAEHHDGDWIPVSDSADIVVRHCTNLDYVVQILTTMGVVDDDRPQPLEPWLHTKLANLPPAIAREVHRWAGVLRDGGPRIRARHVRSVRIYVAAVVPALADWSARYDNLREVTRDDVVGYLDTLPGNQRETALSALRSLFGWTKRHHLVFRNPTARVRGIRGDDPVWQPLRPAELAHAVAAATTPQAKLFVALAAVHSARPGQIRALHVDGVDLAGRRITIAGHDRPLDELTYQVLVELLDYRRQRWPNTANPHLMISREARCSMAPSATRGS